ncbi:NAD-dependent epimerase/dehydratase family protein [Candidatus Chlorohelix sp.]|uniref:NAD-dependent epimerase/dehydratase family protein n=1 Tax=Candidatus Chlorohelix sp. TaxID=3139201 RepID=UPI003027BFDC
MKRVIITGATGFVGANLTRQLLLEGHEIHLLVRHGYQLWRIEDIKSHLHFHEIAFEDAQRVVHTIAQIRPDWIFHLATYGAYSSQGEALKAVYSNFLGTVNLVEACLKCGFEAFVNTGSSSEYGLKNFPPAENTLLEPNSYYAVTKAAATMYCRYSAQRYQVHIPTLRLYSVYGPYEEPTRLIPTLITQGLQGELPPLVNPAIARDYVHVDDVCEAYLLAAGKVMPEAGAIYNVGCGQQTSLAQVVEFARRSLDIRAEPQWGSMANRQWDSDVWVSDNRKIEKELGWKPRLTFEQGFNKNIEWFKDNPKLLQYYYDHREFPK